MSSSDNLNARQKAFIDSYVVKLSGIDAARDAGYTGNLDSLAVTASRLLGDANVKAELAKRFKEHIMQPEELLTRLSFTASADMSKFVDGDGNVNVQALQAAGLGHLVREFSQTSQGTKIKLHDAQRAQEVLAKYHDLLTDRVDLTTNGKAIATEESIDKLSDIIARATDRSEG